MVDVQYEIPLECGKIREFARATQSTDPAYRSTAPLVPPTFLTTAAHFWEPTSVLATLGLDLRRVLHGEEEFVFHGTPPRAGQTLTVSTRLVDEYERAGRRGGTMRFAVVLAEFRDDEGTLVAEQRTTVIETAGAAVAGGQAI